MAAKCNGCGRWHENAYHGVGFRCTTWVGLCNQCKALEASHDAMMGMLYRAHKTGKCTNQKAWKSPWNTCTECGARVAPWALHCPQCGGDHLPDEWHSYCPQCGKPQEESNKGERRKTGVDLQKTNMRGADLPGKIFIQEDTKGEKQK